VKFSLTDPQVSKLSAPPTVGLTQAEEAEHYGVELIGLYFFMPHFLLDSQ